MKIKLQINLINYKKTYKKEQIKLIKKKFEARIFPTALQKPFMIQLNIRDGNNRVYDFLTLETMPRPREET